MYAMDPFEREAQHLRPFPPRKSVRPNGRDAAGGSGGSGVSARSLMARNKREKDS
jgi:hypothetical protein